MSFPLFLALKYLKPKRSVTSVVTVFSIVGVLLGVAIMIIVRAVMTGFGEMLHDKLLDFKPHITISADPYAQGNRITGEDELAARIAAVPGVTGVSPAIELRVLADFNENILAPVLIGVDPAAAADMLPFLADMWSGE